MRKFRQVITVTVTFTEKEIIELRKQYREICENEIGHGFANFQEFLDVTLDESEYYGEYSREVETSDFEEVYIPRVVNQKREPVIKGTPFTRWENGKPVKRDPYLDGIMEKRESLATKREPIHSARELARTALYKDDGEKNV